MVSLACEVRGRPSRVALRFLTVVLLANLFSVVTVADGGGWSSLRVQNKVHPSQSLQYSDPWVGYDVDVRDTGSGAMVTVFGVNLTDGTPSLGAKLLATVSPTNLTFAAEPINSTPGAYAISIYVSDLGGYTFRILSCGTDDICNPISNDVYAFNVGGALSASESFASGYQETYNAGDSVSFNITAEDSHGIVETVIYEPCPFAVNISSIVAGEISYLNYQIVSQGHGIYEVICMPDRVQVYFVSVTLNGVPVYGGQFSFNTTIDAASVADNFILTNDNWAQSHTVAVGGHIFSITCTHTSYQVINNFTVVVASTDNLSQVLYALEFLDSRTSVGCTFQLDLFVPGNYSVDVYLLGEPIQNAPYILEVVPAMADSIESALTVKYAGITAGETISYQATLKDFYGNPASSVFEFGNIFPHLTVGLYSSLPPKYGNISAFLDNFGNPIAGKYVAKFNATVSGNFTVVAFFGLSDLDPLTGSGFTLVVSPNLPSAGTSYLGSFNNVTVGSSSLLLVYLRDVYNNTVPGSPSAIVTVTIFNDLSNFSFPCAVVGQHLEASIEGIFEADVYQVNVSLNGSPFFGGYELHVFGGVVDPENCSFIGLRDTQAGVRNSFVLQLADQYGNVAVLDADFLVENYLVLYSPNSDNYADVEMTLLSPGFYNVTYSATKANIYVVSFSIGHKQLTSEISVLPGALDVRQCSFSGPGTVGGTVNRNLYVHITPRDPYGNRLHVNDVDKSIFEISGLVKSFNTVGPTTVPSGVFISPISLDLTVDTYVFQYSGLSSGRVVLAVAAQGVAYKIETTLNSGRLSIRNTYLSGLGLNGTTCNRSAVFYINALDVCGNIKNDPGSIGESFRTVICSQTGACSSSSIRVVDEHLLEGRYAVTYQASTSGNFTIYVSWHGKDVSGSPLVVPVVDANVNRLLDPSQFIIICDGLSTSYSCPGPMRGPAGQGHNFTVIAADSRGIPLLSGGEAFALSTVPDVGLNPSLEDQENGIYVLHYCIYVAGNFTLTLTYNSVAIIVQKVWVSPAPTSASKSTLVVPLPVTISVGVPFSSAVILLDEFSNEQVYGLEYPYSQDQVQIVALKSTGEQISGTVSVADNSSFIVSVLACFAGAYNVSVSLNGDLISGGNQFVIFEPTSPVASKSRIIYNDLAVAGELATIRVFPVDGFGNNLVLGLNCSATAMNVRGEVFTPPYCELSAHPIQVVYNLTEVGLYLISISLYDLSGTGFQFSANVTVKSGQPAPQNSGPVDQDAIAVKTGATGTIVINCQDAWGNICMEDYSGLFSVTLWPSDFPVVFARVAFVETRIVATYLLYRPGNYTVEVQLSGVPVSGNLVTVTATPAPSSAFHSFALYGPNAAAALNTSVEEAKIAAGTVGHLKVVIVDIYGNRQDRSVEDVLNITFAPAYALPPYIKTGAYAKPFDIDHDHNADGTYAVLFLANAANYFQINSYISVKYFLSVAIVGQDGMSYDIGGSPFTFLVTTGPVNVAKSLIRQTESWSGVHGLMWMVTLTPKDSFGNVGPFSPTLNVTANLAQGQVADTKTLHKKFLSDGSTADWFSSQGYEGLLEIDQMLQGEENGTNYAMPPMVVDNYNGTYFIYFSVMKSGSYNISVFINNALVGGPLFTIMNYEVTPGPVDMMRLMPSGLGLGYKGTVAGQLSAILLRFTDKFANAVNLSQDAAVELVANLTASFRVRVWSRSSFVEFPDEDVVARKNFSLDGHGLLWLFYQPLKSGQLILNLGFTDPATSYSQEVFGSPFFGTVEPGTVLSSNCYAFGPGLHSALGCNKYICPNSSIFLEARDSYNNLVSSQTSPGICQGFTVIAGPSLTCHAAVPYNGRCLLTYTASKVSTQNIAIQYLWSPIQSSPFQLAVRPTIGDASPRKSLAWGDLGGTVIAGTAAIITVQLVDSNGIELYESPSGTSNHVTLVLVNSTVDVSSPTLISKNNYDGTFTLKLTVFSSGVYTFNILMGPMKLPLGGKTEGYVLRVVSGRTSISKTTTLLVSNHSFYRAGETSVMIEVRAMDKLSNLQDYVMGSIDFYEAQIFQPDGTSVFVPLTQDSAVTGKGVPYSRWVLKFIPLQAPYEGSVYEFQFLWTDGYLREHIQTKISVPTYPGQALLEHTQIIGQGASSAFSGVQTTFIVQLYDAYHNPVRTESDVVDLNITIDLLGMENIQVNCSISTSPFGWACSYSAGKSGSYSMQVTFRGTDSKSFPNVTVSPSSAYAPFCTASGDGIGTGGTIYAGVPVRFVIEPYDIVQNPIVMDGDFFLVVVVIYNETVSTFLRPDSIYPRWTGTNYEVYYTPVRAGYGEVHVRSGNDSIQNSPFAIHVNPGPVSAEQIIMRPSSFVSCMAGDMHSLTLVSRDMYDNVRPGGRDIFQVSRHVDSAPDESDVSTMTPLGSGVYQYVYRCQHACSILNPNCCSITVSSGESTVLSTNLRVVPGPVDISKCVATLFGRTFGAGSEWSVSVTSKDSFGNQLWIGGLDFQTFITSGDTNSSITSEDNGDGTYLFKCIILTSGNHTIQTSLHGQLFFIDYIEVVPGPPDPRATFVAFDKGGYASGIMGSFQIQLFDKFLNYIVEDVLEPSLLLLSLTSAAIPSTLSYPDVTITFMERFYNVSFTPNHPGILHLGLNVSGVRIFDVNSSSVFSSVVASGPPSISKFSVFGAGIDAGGIVHHAAVFFVHVKDSGGNLVTTRPPGTWGLTFSPTNVVAVRPTPFFLQNGTVQFTYIPVTPASDLAISVLYGGQRVGSTRYVKIKTQPGFWSLRHCVALDPLGVPLDRSVPLVGRVGTNLTITIQIRDKDGMDVPDPDPSIISFIATASGVPIPVTPTSGGPLGLTLTETVSSKYVVEISSPDGRQFIRNSGFVIHLLPGPSFPLNTEVLTSDGQRLLSYGCSLVAGDETIFQLQARDAFKNEQALTVSEAPDIFSASLVALPRHGLFNSYLQMYNSGDKHTLYLAPYLSGEYSLTIYLNEEFAGSFAIHVTPAVLNFSNFEVSLPASTNVFAGVESSFEIKARDSYYNTFDAEAIWHHICVELQPTDGSTATRAGIFLQANTTALLVSFVVPLRGWYNVVISDATSQITGNFKSSNWTRMKPIEALAGPIYSSAVLMTLPRKILTAGDVVKVLFTAYDVVGDVNYSTPQVTTDPPYAVEVLSTCPSDASAELVSCGPYSFTTFLLPSMPGRVNVSLTWSDIVLYTNLQIQPAQQPTILSARLSDSLTCITILLDRATDGFEMGTSLNGSARCSALLDSSVVSKLGTSPTCIFRDPMTLLILLGHNATILPADSESPDYISLKENIIYAAGNNSLPVTGSVVLLEPIAPIAPKSKLLAPTSISPCDSLVLDASGSSGSGGRPLLFFYSVQGTGDPKVLVTIGRWLYDIPSSRMNVVINAEMLQAGQRYTFSVTVVNFVGAQSRSSVAVTTTYFAVPMLTTLAADEILFGTRENLFEVEALATVPAMAILEPNGSCSLLMNSLPIPTLEYKWIQTAGPILEASSVIWNARFLTVRGELLNVGYVYNFSVQCSLFGFPMSVSVAHVALAVHLPPLSVIIVGGNRTINLSESFTLEVDVYDGDNSVDVYGNPSQCNYVWSCDPDLGADRRYPLDELTVGNGFGKMITIPGGYLTSGTYKFSVKVDKEPSLPGRFGVTSWVVVTAGADLLTVTTTLDNAVIMNFGIPPSQPLEVTCTSGLDNYKWSIASASDQRDLVLGIQSVEPASHRLRIPANTLLGGISYTISCNASSTLGFTGGSSVRVFTVSDPTGGSVDLSSDSEPDIAGQTLYTLVAHGWSPGDGNRGLKYEFRYSREDGEETVLQPLSLLNYVRDVVVKAGNVTFRVYVANSGEPIRFCADAPPGALFELPPVAVGVASSQGPSSSAEISPAYIQDTLYYNFLTLQAQGEYLKALCLIEIFGSLAVPKSPDCLRNSSLVPVVNQMLGMVEATDWKYPQPYVSDTVAAGSGPYIALALACALGEIFQAPGNVDFQHLNGTLRIFKDKLALVAAHQIGATASFGHIHNTCFLDAVDALVNAVYSSCAGAPESLIEKASQMPLLLALILLKDNGSLSTNNVVRPSYALATASVDIVPEMQNNVTCSVANFLLNASIWSGEGTLGAAVACFPAFAPLSTWEWEATHGYENLIAIFQTCDLAVSGIQDTSTVRVVVSFLNLVPPAKNTTYAIAAVNKDSVTYYGRAYKDGEISLELPGASSLRVMLVQIASGSCRPMPSSSGYNIFFVALGAFLFIH